MKHCFAPSYSLWILFWVSSHIEVYSWGENLGTWPKAILNSHHSLLTKLTSWVLLRIFQSALCSPDTRLQHKICINLTREPDKVLGLFYLKISCSILICWKITYLWNSPLKKEGMYMIICTCILLNFVKIIHLFLLFKVLLGLHTLTCYIPSPPPVSISGVFSSWHFIVGMSQNPAFITLFLLLDTHSLSGPI